MVNDLCRAVRFALYILLVYFGVEDLYLHKNLPLPVSFAVFAAQESLAL